MLPGQRVGRWTMVRRSVSAQRRPSDNGIRERVVVRCVCGEERIVWLQDIQCGRSSGCNSRRCLARFEVAEEIKQQAASLVRVEDFLMFVDRWVREGQERDEQRRRDAEEREFEKLAARGG